MTQSRGTLVWLVWLATSIALAVAAWVLGSRVTTPDQAAADALPPEPSLITAPVVFERLSDSFVVSGEVVAPESVPVIAHTPEGMIDAVVLAVPSASDMVDEGVVVAVVSGRPVIAIQGPFPLYRDLERGVEGPDVRMVQQALERLGLFDSEVDGVFGRETEVAVDELYELLGYQVPEPANPGFGARAPRLRLAAREVLVVASLPAVVISVGATPGDRVDDGAAIAVIAQGDPIISLVVRGPRSGAMSPGLPVRLFIDAAGVEGNGSIAAIGDQQADFAEGLSREVFVEMPGLSAVHVGMGVRAVLATQETEEEVFAVPVGAVFSDDAGGTSVVAVIGTEQVSIPVTLGRVIGGFVELIGPDDRLAPGLSVVIGWR